MIWLCPAVGGILLTVTTAPFFFTSARWLRAWFWSAIILFGDAVAFPLKVTALFVGLLAALPICAATVDAPEPGSTLQVTPLQMLLVGICVVFRVFIWPGIAMDWDRVRKWEQEVVRRPKGGLWAHIQAGSHASRERLHTRATTLGLALAEGELKSTPSLAAIPKQSLGLLLVLIASKIAGRAGTPIATELNVLLIFCSVGVFLLAFSKQDHTSNKPDKWLLLTLVPALTLMASRVTIHAWPVELSNFHSAFADLARFSILAAVVALFLRDVGNLFDFGPGSAAPVGFAPLDKKYSFLKTAIQTVQSLANPAHLVSLFIHFDVLLTTLRITLS
ncbi:MAG: hypothetical protein ACO3A4_10620 [Silvanigrellaceae bacterium]